MEKFISDFQYLILGVIGAAIWLVRLEGQVKGLKEVNKLQADSIKEIKFKHDSLDNKIMEKLSEVEKTLARIEGHLGLPGKE